MVLGLLWSVKADKFLKNNSHEYSNIQTVAMDKISQVCLTLTPVDIELQLLNFYLFTYRIFIHVSLQHLQFYYQVPLILLFFTFSSCFMFHVHVLFILLINFYNVIYSCHQIKWYTIFCHLVLA